MSYALSTDELDEMLSAIVNGSAIADENLAAKIRFAEDWQFELSVLSYTLAKVAERRRAQGRPHFLKCVELCFDDLPNQMWFSAEEVGDQFVDYLLRIVRDRRIPFDEQLAEIHSNFMGHSYGKAVRV